MSDYTPGPWEVREGWEEVFGPAVYTPDAHDTQPLAAVNEVGNPNADADARLMAAAPDLLAALDHLLLWFPEPSVNTIRFNDIGGGVFARDVDVAQAAIAKATGEKEKSAPAPDPEGGTRIR